MRIFSPKTLVLKDTNPMYGDPASQKQGGTNAEDYIPANGELIKDKEIPIEKIPGYAVEPTLG